MIKYFSIFLATLLVYNSFENIIYLQSNQKQSSDWLITKVPKYMYIASTNLVNILYFKSYL